MLPFILAFGIWSDILAGVRTLNNTPQNFRTKSFSQWEIGEIFHLKQKRIKPFLSRFREKQVSQTMVSMPCCRATHKMPERMWIAGHTPWVVTALTKNVGPQ